MVTPKYSPHLGHVPAMYRDMVSDIYRSEWRCVKSHGKLIAMTKRKRAKRPTRDKSTPWRIGQPLDFPRKQTSLKKTAKQKQR
jgi:hypothetical protein